MVLQILRSKRFAKWTLTGILILIIPAFILWGVGSVSKKSEIIGEIGGKKISLDDLAKSQRGIKTQMLFSYHNDYEMLNNILKNRAMINYISWERLVFLDAARKLKIKIPNQSIVAFISQHPLFQRNGVFNQEVYEYILRNNLSMDPRQFEEAVRENLMVRTMRQYLLKDITVSDEEVLEFYKENNDKVELSYMLIDKDLFQDEATVSLEESRETYEKNRSSFVEPAKTEVEYMQLPYEDPDEKNSIVRNLEKIYPSLIESPSDFEVIAEENGISYGKTEPFSRDEVIPGIAFFKDFHETAFSLAEGEVSPPLFSSEEKGTAYILRKTGNIPPRLQAFEEVEEKIEADIKYAKALMLAQKSAEETYEKLAGGTSLEEFAAGSGQEVKSTGVISPDAYIENAGPAGEAVLLARKSSQGEIIPPVLMEKGVLIARVDAIIPADMTSFDAEKKAVHEGLIRRKQIDAMNEWFKQNESRIKLHKRLEEL